MLKKLKRFYYTKILRKKYYTTGKCLHCGKCCRQIYVKHGRKVINDEKLFKKLQFLHEFYTYLEIVGKDELGLIFKCTKQDPVTNLCTIHKKRPFICQRYPQEEILTMGGGLSDDCGYKLEPIVPFSEVLENVMKKA